jgi:hypothetical protein
MQLPIKLNNHPFKNILGFISYYSWINKNLPFFRSDRILFDSLSLLSKSNVFKAFGILKDRSF